MRQLFNDLTLTAKNTRFSSHHCDRFTVIQRLSRKRRTYSACHSEERSDEESALCSSPAHTPGSAKLTPIPKTPACQALAWQRSALNTIMPHPAPISAAVSAVQQALFLQSPLECIPDSYHDPFGARTGELFCASLRITAQKISPFLPPPLPSLCCYSTDYFASIESAIDYLCFLVSCGTANA